MATKAIKALGNLSTTNILNSIRYDMDDAYKMRIPDATQGNLAEIAQTFHGSPEHRNKLIHSLLDKVGLTLYKNYVWSNPLAELKIGQLSFGESIEEFHVNMVRGRRFNPDAQEVHSLGRYKPDVDVFYYPSIEPRIYPVSIDDNSLLQRGFYDQSSLSGYMTSVMSALAMGAQYDDLLIAKQNLGEFYKKNNARVFKVNIGDISTLTGDDKVAALRDISVKIRVITDKMCVEPSRLYNPAGRDVVSKKEDLIIFTTPEMMAELDVQFLANVFQLDKAEMQTRVIVLSSLPIPKAGIIVMDRGAMIMADKRIETTSQQVAAGGYTNHFLLHDMLVGISRVSNIAVFTTEAATAIPTVDFTVTGVTVNAIDTTGYRDADTYAVNLSAVVAGTSTPAGIPVPGGVEWKLMKIGFTSDVGTAPTAATSFGVPIPGTQITPNGDLVIAEGQLEALSSSSTVLAVQVMAVSTLDDTKSGSAWVYFDNAAALA